MGRKFLLGLTFLTVSLAGCKLDLNGETPLPPASGNLGGQSSSHTFLFIIDNSGSLIEARTQLINKIGEFISILKSEQEKPFQMVLTTTDMFYFQGNPLKSASGMNVVKSDSLDPEKDFIEMAAEAITHPDPQQDTSFWEQGLEASFQCVYKFPDLLQIKDSTLNLVYITNSEDYSCKDECWGVEPENNVNWKPWEMIRYVNYFKSLERPELNIKVSVFPMVGTSTSPCAFESVGSKYLTLQSEIGRGAVGSICRSEFEQKLLDIAHLVAKGN